MKAVAIRDNIYWVGGIDYTLRNFHGYLTPRGSTYNAYLIIDEKITLIDTVKHYLFDEMIERISSIIDPKKIDQVICNHVEMDHSGGLPRLMEMIPNAKVFASAQGQKGLMEHYRKEWNFSVVKTGDSVSLGKRSLSFIMTPMIHWPDNMISYCPEEKILFSNDSFGQHIATPERFDDELPVGIVLEEAQKYYGNIVLSYNSQVQKALEAASQLDISMIAPSHGIIWRSHIPEIVAKYNRWSTNQTDNLALVIYDTMWDSTAKLAEAIRKGFENKGVKVKIHELRSSHISDVMTDVVEAKYICVGSPTLNSNMLPTVAGFLTYLRSLSPKKRTGLAFGSFGWGGQSIDQVEEGLKSCGFEMLEQVRTKYIPEQQTLDAVTTKIESLL
ncbi:MAG: FprA family A-type flavoprotein [Fibrobacter sp.]|nr:FprA family A-type flavoprotein [Fibrobacter sp.]